MKDDSVENMPTGLSQQGQYHVCRGVANIPMRPFGKQPTIPEIARLERDELLTIAIKIGV